MHPLPEDVTRKSTFEIVEAIRCEGIRAIDALVAKGLIKENVLPQTYIGYDFQFLITENNNASGSGVFRYPFSSGTFTLGVSGGAERARNSDRNFRIMESFDKLLEGRKLCSERGPAPNSTYPVAGSIGLGEVITTYARIDGLTTLRPLASKEAGSGKKSGDDKDGEKNKRQNLAEYLAEESGNREPLQTFSDKLTFTTKLKGGVKPSVVLSPVPGNFRLVEAVADLSADRTDVHKVTVAIAVDKEKRRSATAFYVPGGGAAPYYNAFAPSLFQSKLDARERIRMELDRQRLLELNVIGVTP